MQSRAAFDPERPGDFRAEKMLRMLRKQFWIPALFLAAGLASAIAFLALTPKRYRSDAVIQVEQKVATATGAGATTVEDLQSIEMLNTVAKNFSSRALMQRVADKLQLVTNDKFWDGRLEPGESREDAVIALLYKNSRATLIRLTRLIDVSFEHRDPDIARQVCQALVDEFIKLDLEQRLLGAGSNIKYLRDEAASIEQKLRASEESLHNYTRKLGTVSIDKEMNIVGAALLEISSKMTAAKAERLRLQSDYAQIGAIGDDPEALLQLESIRRQPGIDALLTRVNVQRAEFTRLAQRYGEKHPKLIEARSELSSLREALYAEVLKAPRSVEVALRAAQENEESLDRERKSQEGRVMEIKGAAIQSKVLERQIEANRMAYESVLERLNVETSQARSQPVLIQTREPATPGVVVFPRPVLVLAASVVLSLLAGVGVVLLLAYLDNSVRGVDEAERIFQCPVLAAVPHHESPRAARRRVAGEVSREFGVTELPMKSDSHSAFSEAIRTLRASLVLSGEGGAGSRRILVTSAIAGEGKSFVATNLAIAFAQQDFRTLFVDADIRRPMVANRFFGTGGLARAGLTDYLLGRTPFEAARVPSGMPGLDLLVAGSSTRNPAELLSRRSRMEELLCEAEKEYGCIIADSAPVLAVSDTLSMANLFTCLCVVVRAQRTPSRLVHRAISLLIRGGKLPRGIVLNNIPMDGSYEQYYYAYQYAYSGTERGTHRALPQ